MFSVLSTLLPLAFAVFLYLGLGVNEAPMRTEIHALLARRTFEMMTFVSWSIHFATVVHRAFTTVPTILDGLAHTQARSSRFLSIVGSRMMLLMADRPVKTTAAMVTGSVHRLGGRLTITQIIFTSILTTSRAMIFVGRATVQSFSIVGFKALETKMVTVENALEGSKGVVVVVMQV